MEENKFDFIVIDKDQPTLEEALSQDFNPTPVQHKVEQPVEEVKVEQPAQEQQPKVKPDGFSNFIDFDVEGGDKFDIKVVGIGGAGCNIIKHINDNYPSIKEMATLYAFNTDRGSLQLTSGVANRFLLNKEELKGYGSGSDPEVGRQAVVHDAEIIKKELAGTDVLFIVAGLGKGAGSGGAPELARIAKELGILTISIVNTPSIACEGNVIFNNSLNALQSLMAYADSITTISNERIISTKKDMSFYDAYGIANDEMAKIIDDLISIIFKPTVMNIDFADLRTFFKKNKFFLMSRVAFDSNNVNEVTVKNAIVGKIKQSLSDIDINNAKDLICNISMSKNTPTNFPQIINHAISDYTNNSCLSMSTGIDYNDNNRIDISFIISGNNSVSEFGQDISTKAEEVKWHNNADEIKKASINNEFNDLLKDINDATVLTKDFGKNEDDIG